MKAMQEPVRRLLRVPLQQVRPCYEQPREVFNQDKLEELAQSIAEQGLIQPVLVRSVEPDASGRTYEIVDGERRWRALQLLARVEMDVLVDEGADADEQFLQAAAANTARAGLTPLEVARAVARMSEMPRFSALEGRALRQRLAKVLGRSELWVERMLKVDGLGPEAKELLRQKKLTLIAAEGLASVPLEKQAIIGRRVTESGLPSHKTAKLIRDTLKSEGAKPRVGRPPNEIRFVRQTVVQISQLSESLLDMSATRLTAAYGTSPNELSKALELVATAVSNLEQLRQALERLQKS